MHEREALARLQAALARAVVAGDLDGLRRDAAALGAGDAVARIDRDGFRLAALLVARLRFERLMQGSDAAAERFARDPAGFVALFRRYHAAVPAPADGPWSEAAAFARWLAAAPAP